MNSLTTELQAEAATYWFNSVTTEREAGPYRLHSLPTPLQAPELEVKA